MSQPSNVSNRFFTANTITCVTNDVIVHASVKLQLAMCEPKSCESKSALVSLSTPSGLRTRVVKYSGDVSALRYAIQESFKDILHCSPSSIILQLRDDSWGENVFVDVIDLDQDIPDRAVMRVMETIHSKEGAANNQSISTQSVSIQCSLLAILFSCHAFCCYI